MAVGEAEENPRFFGPPSPKPLLDANLLDNSASISSNPYSLKRYLAAHSSSAQQLSLSICPTVPQPFESNGASASASASSTLPPLPGNAESFREAGDCQNETRRSSVGTSHSVPNIDDLLRMKPALDIIEMGFPLTHVRTVIELKVRETGESYETAADLFETVSAYQTAMECADDQEHLAAFSLPRISEAVARHEEKTMQKQQAVKSRSNVRSPRIEKSSDKKLAKDGNDICTDGDEVNGNLSAVASSFRMPSSLTLKEENRKMKSSRLCKICQENEQRVVFLPCGHLISCADCSLLIMKCTLCDQPVKGSVKVFLA